ncbi:MAG: RDD family protein [Candidatus Omnitrophota bacterium]
MGKNNTNPTTQGKRFINLLLDLLFLNIAVALIVIVFSVFGLKELLERENVVVSAVLYLLYYLITESIWGRSPGKFYTKTSVVMADGEKPEMRDIFIRTVCRFIPFEAFSHLFSKNPIGWHDRISGTLVIDDTAQQKEELHV